MPGPFTLAADQPQSLAVTINSRIRNESLACPAGVSVIDTATLSSANKPEETNDPTSSGRPPSVSISAAAAVQVTAACGPTENQTPPPGSAPTAPQAPTVTPTPVQPQAASTVDQPQPGAAPVIPLAGTEISGTPVATPVKPQPPAVVCTKPSLLVRIAGPRRVVAGRQLTFRISVRNVGPGLARSVVLRDRIPTGFSLLRSTPRAGFASGVARFNLPNLRPGQTATVRLTMHASRGIAGHRLQQARIVSGCGGSESARAPITVSAVRGVIAPAVTG
jgi:uncharacterized repeat protein (TIGR01451 family)